MFGHASIVEFLAFKGANIDANSFGYVFLKTIKTSFVKYVSLVSATPMHVAAAEDHAVVVEILFAFGADL